MCIFRNLKNYLSEFRILTDEIVINPGFIINLGVLFRVYGHKHANKQTVKLNCIEKIINYFSVDKMQFRQSLYINQLEYELMGIDGVRGVNYVTLTQENDYTGEAGSFDKALFSHSIDASGNVTNENGSGTGALGYGYKYVFENAISDDGSIIFPSQDPSVFELKNPKQNIKGVVR